MQKIREIFSQRGIWYIGIFWLIFTYLWREGGIVGWEAKVLFDNGWIREAVGHTFAGIVMALCWIYMVRRFGKRLDAFCRAEPILFLLSTLWIATTWAVFWEGFEAIRDIIRATEHGFIPAQTSGVDTTLDIFLTWVGAIIGYGIYHRIKRYRHKKYPEEACDDIAEKIENSTQHLHDLIGQYHKKRREIKKDNHRARAKARLTALKKVLSKLFHTKKTR